MNKAIDSEKGFNILNTKHIIEEDVVGDEDSYVVKRVIFKDQNKFYSMQYVFDREDGIDGDSFIINRVKPIEKTIIVYDIVEDED